MKRRLKVLLLFDSPYFTPRGYDFIEEFKDDENWYTENDVYRALLENDYEVSLLGVFNDIHILLEEIKEFKPDIVFNLAEVFDDKPHLDKNIVSLLEMLKVLYTGASSDTLFICNNKALSKKILRFHRLRVAHFHVFQINHKIWLPKYLKLPLVVKPLCEEASRGISQASVVDSEAALVERVKFIHESMEADAIAEEYIEGRELYITIMGDKRITVFPPREFKFGKFPEDEPRIATYKAKWDDNHRDKWGIKSVYAGKLPVGMDKKIVDVCKRAYRTLGFRSYTRFDIRITPDGKIYILEPNANPCLARIGEVAHAVEKAGVSYNQLIKKIVTLGLRR